MPSDPDSLFTLSFPAVRIMSGIAVLNQIVNRLHDRVQLRGFLKSTFQIYQTNNSKVLDGLTSNYIRQGLWPNGV